MRPGVRPAAALLAGLLAAVLAGCTTAGHRHARFAADPEIRLDASGSRIESAAIGSPAFDEAVLSWDIVLHDGASAALDASVLQGGVWSGWLRVARRGARVCVPPVREADSVRIDVDTVICREPAEAIRWRVSVCDGPVTVRSVWVTTTGVGRGGAWTDEPHPGPVAHAVPHKAQRDGGAELGGRLCSPTAVAMVVESRGVPVGVGDMAERVYDADFDLYGNWVNNTLGACELGVPMRLTRIGSWAEARSFLEAGPIVVSLPPFRERELSGAGYSSASGHLIVISGLDEAGGVLVRDPAHPDAAGATRVYRRDQLTRLWLRENKGTAYVLDPG